ASPCNGPRPAIGSRITRTSPGNSGISWSGAATTTVALTAVPTRRTMRWSNRSGPNGSHALGEPIRRLSPPQRTTAPGLISAPPAIQTPVGFRTALLRRLGFPGVFLEERVFLLLVLVVIAVEGEVAIVDLEGEDRERGGEKAAGPLSPDVGHREIGIPAPVGAGAVLHLQGDQPLAHLEVPVLPVLVLH